MYRSFFKSLLDVLVALICIIIASPLFVICIILLLVANNGKPFFLQKRPGKNEKIFTLIKFKTMNDKKDKNGNLLSDEERIGPLSKKNFFTKTNKKINKKQK